MQGIRINVTKKEGEITSMLMTSEQSNVCWTWICTASSDKADTCTRPNKVSRKYTVEDT